LHVTRSYIYKRNHLDASLPLISNNRRPHSCAATAAAAVLRWLNCLSNLLFYLLDCNDLLTWCRNDTYIPDSIISKHFLGNLSAWHAVLKCTFRIMFKFTFSLELTNQLKAWLLPQELNNPFPYLYLFFYFVTLV
jgi:hypothetical protein